MAQQIINVGAAANDGTGDPNRTAFEKVNDNFSELYARGAAGSNFDLSDNRIVAINSNGDVQLVPNGGGQVSVESDSIVIEQSRTVVLATGEAGDRAGMIAWDGSYVYVCILDYDGSTVIWRRSALTSW